MPWLKTDFINKICYIYKLEVLGVDGKFKSRFIFGDYDCVKLIGKSPLKLKTKLIEVATSLSSKRVIYI